LKLWNVQNLADFLGIPETWIYDRTRENGPETIPHIKLGKYIRFNPEAPAFREWLRAHEIGDSVGSDTQRGL
jgi:hypothetical protein